MGISPDHRRPLLFIVSGPAGIGKTTLCNRLLEEFETLRRAVTATTRTPRPGEIDGVDYFFLTEADFQKRKAADGFLESATVHGRLYGTLRSEVDRLVREGFDVLLNIDVQGMRQIRASIREKDSSLRLLTLFIRPPSLDILRKRLEARRSDDPAEIERRLQTARYEIEAAPEFDHWIETGSREEDYANIRALYLSASSPSDLGNRNS